MTETFGSLGIRTGDTYKRKQWLTCQRRFDVRRILSATSPCESVLSIRLRPDFPVVFERDVVRAEHRLIGIWSKTRSLAAIFSELDDCADLVRCL